MAETGRLHDAFLDELHDAYDAEKQLARAFAEARARSSSPQLRAAFETHLKETLGHVQRLEQVFVSLGEQVRGTHCDGNRRHHQRRAWRSWKTIWDEANHGRVPDRRGPACGALRDRRVRQRSWRGPATWDTPTRRTSCRRR
jgi:hypothetical protein